MLRIVVSSILVSLCFCAPVLAADVAVLRAKIVDIHGEAVVGAKLFIYSGKNVRRPADFISAPANADGRTELTLSPGNYLAIARLKNDGTFGPLAFGDRHSGEPVQIDSPDGLQDEKVFVVANIREIGEKQRTDIASLVKVHGSVRYPDGTPAEGSYVFASRTLDPDRIPEAFSAGSDEAGQYELYLSGREKWYLAGARQFLPDVAKARFKELLTDSTEIRCDIEVQ